MKKTIKIMSLYPKEMNIYGDYGNFLTLKKRLEWNGFEVKHISHEIGQKLDESADIILGGGGQDSGQNKIQDDLLKNSKKIHRMVENGTPMLMICGMYQLFGLYFKTNKNEHIDGIGVFDAWTEAGPERLIGNIITESEDFGELVGYENHSGLTYLNKNQGAFAKVLRGAGNNGVDQSEGARSFNAIGSYLHGPVLPKNPRLADEIIKIAVTKKYGDYEFKKLDDQIAIKAHNIAATRPR